MAKTHIQGEDGFAICGLKTRSGDLRDTGYGSRDVDNVELVKINFRNELGWIKNLCNRCSKIYYKSIEDD